MEIERAGRYKDKTNIILKRARQIESWVQDISSDQFLEDDRTKLATYKAFQEIVEACMDIVAKDLAFLREDVLGVLLYGSWAAGKSHEKSDIDICVVAPFAEDKTALWRSAIAAVRDERYDIRILELMPLYLKMRVIEQGVVVYSRDALELYEYFYPFRRIWKDYEHRQTLSREEMREMLDRA